MNIGNYTNLKLKEKDMPISSYTDVLLVQNRIENLLISLDILMAFKKTIKNNKFTPELKSYITNIGLIEIYNDEDKLLLNSLSEDPDNEILNNNFIKRSINVVWTLIKKILGFIKSLFDRIKGWITNSTKKNNIKQKESEKINKELNNMIKKSNDIISAINKEMSTNEHIDPEHFYVDDFEYLKEINYNTDYFIPYLRPSNKSFIPLIKRQIKLKSIDLNVYDKYLINGFFVLEVNNLIDMISNLGINKLLKSVDHFKKKDYIDRIMLDVMLLELEKYNFFKIFNESIVNNKLINDILIIDPEISPNRFVNNVDEVLKVEEKQIPMTSTFIYRNINIENCSLEELFGGNNNNIEKNEQTITQIINLCSKLNGTFRVFEEAYKVMEKVHQVEYQKQMLSPEQTELIYVYLLEINNYLNFNSSLLNYCLAVSDVLLDMNNYTKKALDIMVGKYLDYINSNNLKINEHNNKIKKRNN